MDGTGQDGYLGEKGAPMRGGSHLVSPFPRHYRLTSHLQQRRRVPGWVRDFISGRELDGKWGGLLNALATRALQHRLYDLSLTRVHHHRGFTCPLPFIRI
jgi:hypothetical protein